MAELMPKSHDEVLITLSDKSSGHPKHPQRRIVLTSEAKSRPIGRSSLRSGADLAASANNAWFDNAVMSRSHADLVWDPATQLVFIRDTKSLHGTTHNGFRLQPGVKQRLAAGDTLGFGATVEKDSKSFNPTEVQISSIILGPPKLLPHDARRNTFTVPDDSEIEEVSVDEDIDSESDDGGVSHSVMLLQQSNSIPGKSPRPKGDTTTIDLTLDFQEDDEGEDHEDSVLDFESTAAVRSHISARSSSPCPAEGLPSATELESDPTTTFAPALRRVEQPSQPQQVHEDSETPGDQQEPETSTETNLGPKDEAVNSPSLESAPAPGEFSAPLSSPVTIQERAERLAALARERIIKRMTEEKHGSTDQMYLQNTRQRPMGHGLWMQYRQHAGPSNQSGGQQRVGDKRKFDDFDVPEPSLAGLHRNLAEADIPQTLSMSQIIGNLRSGAADPLSPQRAALQVNSMAPAGPVQENLATPVSPANITSEKMIRDDSHQATDVPAQKEPPRKRMRRVAEAVGYAALGGIAVMSALIATAPDV